MECKNCGETMYERNPVAANTTVVYICPKCDRTLYIWPDGEEKWDPPIISDTKEPPANK